MKKVMLLLISFVLTVSLVGCSGIKDELNQDMSDVFQIVNKKHNYFVNKDYQNWILDRDTKNETFKKFDNYSYHYMGSTDEKLSENEVYILETTMNLYNSYVDLQSMYVDHGDSVLSSSDFKQALKEFEGNLKDIKSKLKIK